MGAWPLPDLPGLGNQKKAKKGEELGSTRGPGKPAKKEKPRGKGRRVRKALPGICHGKPEANQWQSQSCTPGTKRMANCFLVVDVKAGL